MNTSKLPSDVIHHQVIFELNGEGRLDRTVSQAKTVAYPGGGEAMA